MDPATLALILGTGLNYFGGKQDAYGQANAMYNTDKMNWSQKRQAQDILKNNWKGYTPYVNPYQGTLDNLANIYGKGNLTAAQKDNLNRMRAQNTEYFNSIPGLTTGSRGELAKRNAMDLDNSALNMRDQNMAKGTALMQYLTGIGMQENQNMYNTNNQYAQLLSSYAPGQEPEKPKDNRGFITKLLGKLI